MQLCDITYINSSDKKQQFEDASMYLFSVAAITNTHKCGLNKTNVLSHSSHRTTFLDSWPPFSIFKASDGRSSPFLLDYSSTTLRPQ